MPRYWGLSCGADPIEPANTPGFTMVTAAGNPRKAVGPVDETVETAAENEEARRSLLALDFLDELDRMRFST